ncbi:ATP-binding protein [Microbispora sp. RL4-1S]|uniref:ATP-binding protein n=1 Tax=Microbispora oryzae TaxID=2806554 RepID=A0A940WLX6_9ACTN|nr:ATP-binding protein [Microbispora oryzae]MBP2707363.1 ATP-binding protein [Microbispora oryzae]
MTPIYLTSENPRWTPKTEADLKRALEDGLIKESHHLDLKKIPDTKGDNRESAKDMASFAIDGGTLIMGVPEDKEKRTFFLEPKPLNGLAEKAEEIARSIPDPALTILTEEIPSDSDPTRGFLIVHIPASPVAPHMVDGKYYGRGDKTKYVLSDAEVTRLHERRRSADRTALDLLQHEIERDPISGEHRHQAHLFLVAQPLAGRGDMLMDLASGPNWNINLANFIERAYTPALNETLGSITEVSPTIREAANGFRRGRGAARATRNLGEGRIFTYDPSDYFAEDAIELQVHEDGGLRLFFSRLSTIPTNDSQEPMILPGAAVGHTRRFLALVFAAAEEAGYFGNWALAFGATGLNGLRAYTRNTWPSGNRARYDEDAYTRTTATTWAELNKAPGTVTRRLAGGLLRALGVEDNFSSAFED